MESSNQAHEAHGEGASSASESKEAKVAAFCGEFLGLLLGATATVAVAGVRGVVLLLDISRKAILRSCFQDPSPVEVEPVSYYVAPQSLAAAVPPPTYTTAVPVATQQRLVVPRSRFFLAASSPLRAFRCAAANPPRGSHARAVRACSRSRRKGAVPLLPLAAAASSQQKQDAEETAVSSCPNYLKVDVDELRAVAAGLALRLSSAAASPDAAAEEQQSVACINSDLQCAWAALIAPSLQAKRKPLAAPPPLLPFDALREDVPRMFFRPRETPETEVPPWSPEACECQQRGVWTAHSGRETSSAKQEEVESFSPHPPAFFGRFIHSNGFPPLPASETAAQK
ncbi:hypothetical protein Efla_007078 [Eimeria flavescens]